MNVNTHIVLSAMAGSNYAFGRLYEDISKDMYRFAYFMLGNKEDALDAVSDTVTDMYKSIGLLQDANAFPAWCLTILRIKCQKKRKEYVDKHSEIVLNESLEIPVREYDIENIQLKNELMALSEEERSIILLNVIYGYNSYEIGEILSQKATTIRSKQKRALEKLRERMTCHE